MRSRKAFKNTIYALVFQVTSVIAGFIIPRAIIGGFGSAEYGLTVAITNFLGYMFLLRSGLGSVVTASLYKPLAEQDQEGIERILEATEHCFRRIAYMSVIYMIVLSILMAIIVKGDWGYGFVAGMVAVVGLGFYGRYFYSSPYQLLATADQNEYLHTLSQIMAVLGNTMLVLLLIHLGASLHVVMLGSGLVYFGAAHLLKRFVIKKYAIKKPSGRFDSGFLQQRWAGIGHSMARFIHNKTDVVVITLFLNLPMVTIYALYALVTAALNMVITSVVTPAQAALGNILAKGENKLLQTNFVAYETVVHMISIVLFSSAYILILPFMKIYTSALGEGNFIQPLFAMLLLTGELIFCLRLPYDTIVMAAGRFKDTQNGAFIEAGLNLALSIILVYSFGLIGVVIGTVVSILFRLIYFMIFLHNNILYLRYAKIIKRMAISAISVLLNVSIMWKIAQRLTLDTLSGWLAGAVIITICTATVTLAIHLLFYGREVSYCMSIFRDISRKKAM